MEKKVKTESTLLDTYLAYHNLSILPRKGAKESKSDGMPFMPMLLMDAMNLLYEEYIAPLPLRHKEKQLRTRWHEAYKHFMAEFFMPFDDDQMDDICDLMNDFDDYIHNEIEIFRVATMDQFMQYDSMVGLVLSSSLACNILAQYAQILWKVMRQSECTYITSIEIWSHKFLNEYADKRINRDTKQIDLNILEPLRISSQNICHKIIKFAESLYL